MINGICVFEKIVIFIKFPELFFINLQLVVGMPLGKMILTWILFYYSQGTLAHSKSGINDL